MFLFIAPALAVDLTVQVAPPGGRLVSVVLPDLDPSEPRVVELPCESAPRCAVGVVANEVDGEWRVTVTWEEVRRGWLGRERRTVVTNPTFHVPAGEWASMFAGSERPVAGARAWIEHGLHVQVYVTPSAVAASEP